jgi:hypothetical protein
VNNGPPKKQAKAPKLGMLQFVSTAVLLKSIIPPQDMPDTGVCDIIEKKLIALGGPVVYPAQPFKYGYMRIYASKELLRKKPISVRGPLTGEQLKTVAKFVGSVGLKCNSDTAYLKLLKSLLTQKCNVQNPDELDWDDILTHIKVFLTTCKGKTKLSRGSNVDDASEECPDNLITLLVAQSKYNVTALTLKRAIADGRLQSYRPKNCVKNHPHKVRESQVASSWPAKTGQQK